MLCEKCGKNEATFYYRENVNGNVKKMHLCAECAEKADAEGEFKSFGSGMFDNLDSFFDFKPFESKLPEFPFESIFNGLLGTKSSDDEEKRAKACPVCGRTLREYLSNGAGCPSCYETFGTSGLISRSRPARSNTARVPSRLRGKYERERKIETLENEQKEAIRSENYERAAEIRDELKALKEEAGTGTPKEENAG